jgi:PTS system mannose-specific IID component
MSENTNPKKRVKRSDIIKSWLIWLFFSHACYNYERLQAGAFAHSMTPIIKRLYSTKEEYAEALKRHLVFFNTEPNVGTIIHGITIAMEEEKANGVPIDDEAINSIKTGLMGPLAGIGDTLTQGTITPILLSLGLGIALEGNVLGPILYVVLIAISIIGISYVLWMQGYNLGTKAVEQILEGGIFNKVISGAGILGCTVIGALIARYVSLSTPVVINVGETAIALQADVLDRIIPGILPLALTLGVYRLLNKGMNPMKILVIILIVGIVGSLIGII